MNENTIRELLQAVGRGDVDADQALEKLRHLPFEATDFATIDHHRALRCGFAEVIFCPGKTPDQAATIFGRLAEAGGNSAQAERIRTRMQFYKEGKPYRTTE